MTAALATETPTVSTGSALECRTDRATLAHALATVGVAVSRRLVVPLVGGVLLDSHDGHLRLTTTDIPGYQHLLMPA